MSESVQNPSFTSKEPRNESALDDELLFAEETPDTLPQVSWKILIVDDDAEVHTITQLALEDVTFEDRSLSFLSAYSASEARTVIRANPDIAVILLDVVMETEDAGLQLIEYIRKDLGNVATRIILRTGQPGQAPDDIVVASYGINGYRTKTELTARKLFISIVTALRAFSTITQILGVGQYSRPSAAAPAASAATDRPASDLPKSPAFSVQDYSPQSKLLQLLGESDTADVMALLDSDDAESADSLQTMSMVSRIARMVLRIVNEQSTQLGISQTKLAVLLRLSSELDRSASPSTLAQDCGVSRAAMTGLLDALTEEAFIERTSHPSDRRAIRVKLTPAGQTFLENITSEQYQLSELVEAIDETERRMLIKLIMKFIRLLNNVSVR